MKIRLLSSEDFNQLFYTFKIIFIKNKVKFQPTNEEFFYRIYKKLLIDMNISVASFDGTEMTGFILHTSNVYQEILTVYNGGIGVLPNYRNQKIARKIYDFLIPKIRSKNLDRILLEVIENNRKAISFYQKMGFNFKRRLRCYKMIESISLCSEIRVVEGSINDVDFNFQHFEPAFIDSPNHLKCGNEKVLIVKKDNILAGYIIFQPHLGRISQLAVSQIHRCKGIGGSLIASAKKYSKKPLTIMNIPDDELAFNSFLKKYGFQNQVNQYEMELIIK